MKTLIICKDRATMHASFHLESPKYSGEAGGHVSGHLGPNKCWIQTIGNRIEWITEKDFTHEGMRGYQAEEVVVHTGVNIDPLLVMIVKGAPRQAHIIAGAPSKKVVDGK